MRTCELPKSLFFLLFFLFFLFQKKQSVIVTKITTATTDITEITGTIITTSELELSSLLAALVLVASDDPSVGISSVTIPENM